MAGLVIPSRTHVYLSALDTRRLRAFCRSSYYAAKLGSMNGFEIYALTYIVGHMVFQVVSWKSPKNARRNRGGSIVQDATMDLISPRIWPDKGIVVEWPSQRHLRDDTIDEFSDRWRMIFDERFSRKS